MSLNFDAQMLESYSDFSVIHSNITTDDYDDEEKEEMMAFLISQTKDRISNIINENFSQDEWTAESNDLGDKVIKLLKDVTQINVSICKESFLTVFDNALLCAGEQITLRRRTMETPNRDRRLEQERRSNHRLREEIKILKQELEEKHFTIDKLETLNREMGQKEKGITEVISKCSFLESEIYLLKAQLSKDQKHYESMIKETKSREEKLIRDKDDVNNT